MKINNLSRTEIGYFSGISSILFTTFMIIIAFFFSTNYNLFLKTISKLGIDPLGQYPFIIGTIVGGLLLILFHYLYFFENETSNKNIKRGRIFGMISGVGMIGVGIFPDYKDLFFETTHYLSAALFFLTITLSVLYYGFYLKEKKLKKKWNTKLYNLSLFVSSLAIIHLLLSFVKGSQFIGTFEFDISVVWQKITVLSLMTWYILVLAIDNSLIPKKDQKN